jgi:hypothetical protein
MARKAKDLFVLLAERHQRSTAKSKNVASKGKNPASKSKDAAATVKEAGGTLGRWVQGAVRSMRSDDGKPVRRQAAPASRRHPPRQVPRGLLIPGWLLVGMITVALGGGFLIGKFTSGLDADSGLQNRQAQRPGEFRQTAPDLTVAEETATLSGKFYVVGVYYPGERDKAADLARRLRSRGIEKARILFRKNGSISRWATVCYVAPSDDKYEALADLQELEGELGFEAVPRLYKRE